MKTTINILLVCVLALFISQCEVVSDDLLQNPNAPSPDNVSPDFLLNNVQVTLPDFFEQVEENGGEVVRMYHMFGPTYPTQFQAQLFDGEWETAYADILVDIENLLPIANERELYTHTGIARIIKAYVLVALVDNFGPVPLSEALDESNFNPAVDSGQDVYNAAFAQLDSAIADLERDELAKPENDLYYGGDEDAWIRLANTLKLKILYQQRLVNDNAAAINSLLDGELIGEPGEEFVFRYSTNSTNPDSRHPNFTANYLNGGSEYMANNFMNMLFNGKEVIDPRIRYYLYRQVDEPTNDVNEQDCINNLPPQHYAGTNGSGQDGNDPYCEDWNTVGYWGRDHGDDGGIPPDNFLRTVYGVYPAGGNFDQNQAAGVDPSDGLSGAGIQPLWMPFYTDFVEAEVELMINGNPAAAMTALENGVRNSIAFVQDFATGDNPTGANAVTDESFVPDQFQIDQYVAEVLATYNAGDTNTKLNVIAREFYLALWGNGMEAYNLYRRVAPAGQPTNQRNVSEWDLQPTLSDNPGEFYRTFTYPAALVERNSSVSQKAGNGVKVFWDNNPDGFADF